MLLTVDVKLDSRNNLNSEFDPVNSGRDGAKILSCIVKWNTFWSNLEMRMRKKIQIREMLFSNQPIFLYHFYNI